MLPSAQDMLCSDGYLRKQREKYNRSQFLTRVRCTLFMNSYKHNLPIMIDR